LTFYLVHLVKENICIADPTARGTIKSASLSGILASAFASKSLSIKVSDFDSIAQWGWQFFYINPARLDSLQVFPELSRTHLCEYSARRQPDEWLQVESGCPKVEE
jgi:hypothetical protein